MSLQLSESVLQLDELIAAIGSPIGAAAEDQQQAIRADKIVKRAAFSGLIRQGKFGNFLTDCGTSAKTIVLGLDEINPFFSLYAGTARPHLANDAVQNLGFPSCFHGFNDLVTGS